MNAQSLLTGDAVLFVLLIAGVALYLRAGRSVRARVAERARAHVAQTNGTRDAADDPSRSTLRGRARRIARGFALFGEHVPLFDARQRTSLAAACRRAGFYSQRAVSMLVAVKFSLGIGLAVCAVVSGTHLPTVRDHLVLRALLMLGSFMIGMILPEYAMVFQARSRRRKIAVALPDALDLLVICTNAGNSLTVGIQRVAREIRLVSPPLADEFDLTASELQLGGDASISLRHLAERIELPSVRSLVSTLIQSQQYGTPITTALKTLSKTERAAAMLNLEEKAAKLAPKMTLPMMLFILPVVFIIAAGPAVLRLLSVFGR